MTLLCVGAVYLYYRLILLLGESSVMDNVEDSLGKWGKIGERLCNKWDFVIN